MLVVLMSIFVTDTKLMYGNNFVMYSLLNKQSRAVFQYYLNTGNNFFLKAPTVRR